MAKRTICVVVAYPSLPAEAVWIEASLKELERVVKGEVTQFDFSTQFDFNEVEGIPHRLHLWCNHAGVDLGMPVCREFLLKRSGQGYLLRIHGPLVLSSADADGDEVGLTEPEALKLCNLLN